MKTEKQIRARIRDLKRDANYFEKTFGIRDETVLGTLQEIDGLEWVLEV